MMKPVMPLKWYKALSTTEGRLDAGLFPVEGMRSIRQIAETHPFAISELITAEGVEVIGDYPVRIVTQKQFNQISSAITPQGIMALVKIPRDAYSGALPATPGQRVLLLEDIQDPGNLGTLIRTASAFRFSGIVMSEKCADPFSPKCAQSAAGSVLSPWLRRTSSYFELASHLKSDGYRMVAASLDGEGDDSVLDFEKLVIALGNEAAGLSKKVLRLADCRYTIPIDRRRAESLNVAVSGGIVMYLAAISRASS